MSAKLIASKLHTAIVLLVPLIMAAGGILRSPTDFVGPSGRIAFYARIVVIQLLLFGFVVAGIRRSGYSLRALVDDAPWNARRWVRYVAIGVAGFVLWMLFGAVLGFFLRPSPEELRRVMRILPKTPVERLCWIGFAVITSFCEEVLYRGYLLKQFRALIGSVALPVLLQAAVFAMGHVVLGRALMISVSLLALYLGLLALWQRSLVPGMIVHAGTGLVALLTTAFGS